MSLTTALYLTELLKTVGVTIEVLLFVIAFITFIVLPSLLCRNLCLFNDESQGILLKRYIKIGAIVSLILFIAFIFYPSGDIIELMVADYNLSICD